LPNNKVTTTYILLRTNIVAY